MSDAERQRFMDYLEEVSAEVKNWPQWKQDILRVPNDELEAQDE